MNFVQGLIESGSMPFFAAFLLGLLTAISPCPLATNIAAIGFIGKDIQSRKRVFANGLLYTIGRIIAYSLLATILIYLIRSGEDIYGIQKSVSKYGEFIISPFLIITGLLILFSRKIKFGKIGVSGARFEKLSNSLIGSLILGMVFALAFCPSSGLFYFGMLIPLSVGETNFGYFLPSVFALATGLPVAIAAWFLAFSMENVGRFYKSVKKFEIWFRCIVGVLFIFIGIYYAI